jgi:hypothetical protein
MDAQREIGVGDASHIRGNPNLADEPQLRQNDGLNTPTVFVATLASL